MDSEVVFVAVVTQQSVSIVSDASETVVGATSVSDAVETKLDLEP